MLPPRLSTRPLRARRTRLPGGRPFLPPNSRVVPATYLSSASQMHIKKWFHNSSSHRQWLYVCCRRISTGVSSVSVTDQSITGRPLAPQLPAARGALSFGARREDVLWPREEALVVRDAPDPWVDIPGDRHVELAPLEVTPLVQQPAGHGGSVGWLKCPSLPLLTFLPLACTRA